jgi:hypothetical protein
LAISPLSLAIVVDRKPIRIIRGGIGRLGAMNTGWMPRLQHAATTTLALSRTNFLTGHCGLVSSN